MSTFENQAIELPDNTVSGPTGDDLLPPVEPPSASFLIQLFVVPALIVLMIVAVWLTFTWLVRRTTPETIVNGLEQGPSIARWQRASELADMLRNQRFAEFKRDAPSANRLARILERELEQAAIRGDSEGDDEATLRYFLARAIGEFEVQEGVDVLLKAASTNATSHDQLVRGAAIEAIAVRAYNLQHLESPQQLNHPHLMPTLSRLATDEDPAVRSKAAFALGQIGTSEASERLEQMVDDPHADTRYNAAIGLAHRGNAKGIETLAEMLDLEQLARPRAAADGNVDAALTSVLVSSALQAVEALSDKNSDADLAPVIQSLQRLAAAEPEALRTLQLPTRVASDARRVLESLTHR